MCARRPFPRKGLVGWSINQTIYAARHKNAIHCDEHMSKKKKNAALWLNFWHPRLSQSRVFGGGGHKFEDWEQVHPIPSGDRLAWMLRPAASHFKAVATFAVCMFRELTKCGMGWQQKMHDNTIYLNGPFEYDHRNKTFSLLHYTRSHGFCFPIRPPVILIVR